MSWRLLAVRLSMALLATVLAAARGGAAAPALSLIHI